MELFRPSLANAVTGTGPGRGALAPRHCAPDTRGNRGQHDGLLLPRPRAGSRWAAFGRTGAHALRRPPDPARHAGLACRRARMAAAGPLLRRAAARHRRPRRLAAATAAAGDATAGFLRKAEIGRAHV